VLYEYTREKISDLVEANNPLMEVIITLHVPSKVPLKCRHEVYNDKKPQKVSKRQFFLCAKSKLLRKSSEIGDRDFFIFVLNEKAGNSRDPTKKKLLSQSRSKKKNG
jgi:hypothetical protein